MVKNVRKLCNATERTSKQLIYSNEKYGSASSSFVTGDWNE